MRALLLILAGLAANLSASEAATYYCPGKYDTDGRLQFDEASFDPSALDGCIGFLKLYNGQSSISITVQVAPQQAEAVVYWKSPLAAGAMPFSNCSYATCAILGGNTVSSMFPVIANQNDSLTFLWNVSTKTKAYVHLNKLASNRMQYVPLKDLGIKTPLFVMQLPKKWTGSQGLYESPDGPTLKKDGFIQLKVIGREKDWLEVEYLGEPLEKSGTPWQNDLSKAYKIERAWMPVTHKGRLTFWPMLSTDPNHVDERWVDREPKDYGNRKKLKKRKAPK